jgi:hypothetical protein
MADVLKFGSKTKSQGAELSPLEHPSSVLEERAA